MFAYLENDICRVKFSTLGAEIVSFITKDEAIERIWQGNPNIWKGQAPLLFPFIGRLKDGEYIYNNTTYQIPSHGFGRTADFELKEITTNSISFVLECSETTKEIYPFDFSLEIAYTLDGSKITKTHKMTNTGTEPLFYEIGGHDGYNIVFDLDENMEDYYLDFGNETEIEVLCLDENIMITENKRTIPLINHTLPIKMELFETDALMIHRPSFKHVELKSKKSNHVVSMDFHDFDVIAFWTKYVDFNTNYICFEPWSSLPDCSYLGKELEKKIDIRKVEKGETDTLSFSVEIK